MAPAKLRAAEVIVPPPLSRVLESYLANFDSLLGAPLILALHAAHGSSAITAVAAGSSIRSSSPCRSRERRASSAPTLRMSARSSWLSGPRGGRRFVRRLAVWAVSSSASGSGVGWSVVGAALPSTTRRVSITSCPLLSNMCGAVSIGIPQSSEQCHVVIKFLPLAD